MPPGDLPARWANKKMMKIETAIKILETVFTYDVGVYAVLLGFISAGQGRKPLCEKDETHEKRK